MKQMKSKMMMVFLMGTFFMSLSLHANTDDESGASEGTATTMEEDSTETSTIMDESSTEDDE